MNVRYVSAIRCASVELIGCCARISIISLVFERVDCRSGSFVLINQVNGAD